MKSFALKAVILITLIVITGMKAVQEEEIELVCVRKHNASNICHYNFKIAGANYHFKDIGCKEKKDNILKKAKAGKLGLAKDWKIACPEKKDQ